MKHISRYIHGTTLLGLLCAGLCLQAQAGDTKPFRETGQETLIGIPDPGTIHHPFIDELRAAMGRDENAAYAVAQRSNNNVGGLGISLAY